MVHLMPVGVPELVRALPLVPDPLLPDVPPRPRPQQVLLLHDAVHSHVVRVHTINVLDDRDQVARAHTILLQSIPDRDPLFFWNLDAWSAGLLDDRYRAVLPVVGVYVLDPPLRDVQSDSDIGILHA